MAIDSHYIPAFSIEDVLLDKDTGAPLSGGLVYFEQDNQRGVLKPVYQITGTSPNYTYTQLPNPMTLSSIGTFEDSLSNPVVPYFFPYDGDFNKEYYYVRVTSSEDVPQFTREAVPYIAVQGTSEILSVISNELSNPQFSDISFTSPHTFTFSAAVSQVVNIAPDWDLIVTCPTTGSVILTQLKPTGSLSIPTNPGTILTISSAGITRLLLRQRIYGSPNLWGSGFLAASFVAKTYGGSAVDLPLYYSQSSGLVVDQLLVTGSLSASGGYGVFSGNADIPASSSGETFPNAYIDIYFDIPLNIQIDITSVMLAFTGLTSVDNVEYDQESDARQLDHLFHYYYNSIILQPKSSILTGWDFSINPWQFTASTLANLDPGVQARYDADQTIIRPQTTNSLQTGKASTVALRQGYMVKARSGVTPNKFALIQYIDPKTIRPYWDYLMSSLVRARIFTSHGTEVGIKMRLIYRSTLPSTPSTTEPITSMAATDPVFAAGWTAITPRNDPTYTLLNSYSTTDGRRAIPAYSFDHFSMPADAANAETLGVVIYTTGNLNASAGTEDYIVFDTISLVSNEFAIDTNPITFDEGLRQCQFYYEKSFPLATHPTVLTDSSTRQNEMYAGMATHPQTNGGPQNYSGYPQTFGLSFQEQKRTAAPLVKMYSVNGLFSAAINTVNALMFNNGVAVATAEVPIAQWTEVGLGERRVVYSCTDTTVFFTNNHTGSACETFLRFQYTCDARLGLVA